MDARVPPIVADPAVARKLQRLAEGKAPRVLDLFSGCGGISLGFTKAGFSIAAAMEIDELAARSHALNFHAADPDMLEQHAKPRDVTRIEPEDLCAELGLGSVEESIDVIVGGPPCQAYARVGRAKLREVAEHPDAFKVDPRGNLYLRYLAYVRAFRPLALLMENVPDILHYGGHNVVEEIVETLDGYGYDARYSLINSAFHGVPQMRDRVFLVAYRRDLGIRPTFPKASHHMTLPPGYAGTRAVALRFVDLLGGAGYVQADLGNESLPFPVTAFEAIGDMPPIRGDSVKRGARRFGPDTFTPYRSTNALSAYAAAMRQWPGFEGQGGVVDHAIRALPRDGGIFAAMPEGAEYPEAHRVATRLFEEEAARRGITRRMKAWAELEAEMVPPYDPSKFPNRWWKLRRDFPVRTLMAHIGKDTYSHIHYDPKQARTISVREAARLQSFPDGFRFAGTMNPAFRQIGNAVPPMMANALARVMKEALDGAALRLAPPR
ncbi:DNA cytosine methyltransferase [Roseococcus sp. SDR]|uniref:DNA cytosine methyltransferase n=1 Tax=Roseococcus sp. SDR TaxID=2835532 RepID=UPI001BCCD732|nr:DNA cytosine methyltransferase [Roseococcus sp. SDR]MBS7790270.1 DNA cytosine methyltransferase [Roseococcus sp. SDR]MBV1845584.1 DNA cytosine methyltransferase [Roseococcus sp. SDR]